MLRLLKIILPIILLFCFLRPVSAQDKINIYFFYGDGCPHCAKEEKFLNTLEKEYKDIKINRYEVWNNRDNAQFLATLGRELGLDVNGVPLLIVGDKTFVGFYSAETTGRQIKATIEDSLNNGCADVVAPVLKDRQDEQEQTGSCEEKKELPDKINLPLLGEVEVKNLSLPALTVVISAADGFNPCAMWVLLFLISLLLGMENRTKMWILGSAFIVASGMVYLLFLSAWLNLFLFLGFVFWIRMSIGIVALASGGFHLRDWWINRKSCPVAGNEKRRLIFEKIKVVVQTKALWLALAGIIALAFAVNLVELVCSAGLPAVYTQVLALAHLPAWQYYGYLLLYIFVFMLDDMLIFIVAMATLEMKGVSSRYTRWSGLVGGIAILIIGILLLFKPGWLMFG